MKKFIYIHTLNLKKKLKCQILFWFECSSLLVIMSLYLNWSSFLEYDELISELNKLLKPVILLMELWLYGVLDLDFLNSTTSRHFK